MKIVDISAFIMYHVMVILVGGLFICARFGDKASDLFSRVARKSRRIQEFINRRCFHAHDQPIDPQGKEKAS